MCMTVKEEVFVTAITFSDKYAIRDVIEFAKSNYDINLSKCNFVIKNGFITDVMSTVKSRRGYKNACDFANEFESKFDGKIGLIYTVRHHIKDMKGYIESIFNNKK